jgi:hypothetical protein
MYKIVYATAGQVKMFRERRPTNDDQQGVCGALSTESAGMRKFVVLLSR